jgi:hypothetical protein
MDRESIACINPLKPHYNERIDRLRLGVLEHLHFVTITVIVRLGVGYCEFQLDGFGNHDTLSCRGFYFSISIKY